MVVVTGAPGTGKSAILNALDAAVQRTREPAREILAEERMRGGKGTPDQDPALFVELLLRRSIENHRRALETDRLILFDRAVPDCIAYARLLGTDLEPSLAASRAYRYSNRVLVARPWAEIYTTDDERTMAFEATLPFQSFIEDAYHQAGYELIEIPRGALPDRVGFVSRFLANGGPRI